MIGESLIELDNGRESLRGSRPRKIGYQCSKREYVKSGKIERQSGSIQRWSPQKRE